MKKLSVLLIGIIALIMLAACGDTTNEDEASNDSSGETDGKVLYAGSTSQSYPNSYQEDGKLVGFDVEVLEKVAENLGYTVEWVKTDFAGLMGQLETGRIDTVANVVAVTPERAEKYHFSEPYAYAGATIVTHEDNDYTSLDQFKGKTVSGVLGSNNIKNLEQFDPEISAKTYETRDGAMNDAINKRVDGYVNTKSALIAEIEKGDLPLKFVGDPFVYEDTAFPFVKDDDGEKLREEFNKEIEKLREDGTLTEISQKYFAGEDITVKN
ncbi:amino acid ABC transporter substrate-binding protein [Oceanobacillus arenosus]|uniref:Amino acid ABC transporter substrate-binding protein n=2 Tax=Oceanobacillus arenosus TaxID=1229153 RepID=A0A3D8PS61_9BACI|nr:amino acid ABC transporter substrate-binding protein [Oceanobacillus arenosus]